MCSIHKKNALNVHKQDEWTLMCEFETTLLDASLKTHGIRADK
jgi:hypothetical protein